MSPFISVYNFISLLGVFVLVALAWTVSSSRRTMNWRCLAWGIGVQLILAGMVFCFPGSERAFQWFDAAFNRLIQCAQEGTNFVFGPLSIGPGDAGSLGFFLAFQALPLIVFFGALISLLYYFKIMDALIYAFSYIFTTLMRVSGAEALSVSSNIFVGVESFLTVKPYMRTMTRSELFTIIVAGIATIASSVLALYVSILKGHIPNIAGHLMSASIIAAPASIVVAKVMMPETEQPETLGKSIKLAVEGRPSNFVDAAMSGAMDGMTMAINIAALLIAFIGLVALVNLVFTRLFGITIETMLGYLFSPFALIMGVPPEDALKAGELLGLRLIKTEVPAYIQLAKYSAEGVLQPRTQMILSYALCGFAHIASVAIFVGGAVALVPERRRELSALGLRGLLAANLACCMTGAVAGVFHH